MVAAAELYRECAERSKTKDGDEETTRRFLDGLKRAEMKMTTQDRMAEVKAHRGPVIGMAMKPAPAAPRTTFRNQSTPTSPRSARIDI